MKKIIYVIICLASLISCQEDLGEMCIIGKDEHAYFLSTSASELNVASSSFTDYLNITSYQTAWEIVDVPNWMTITPLNGNGSAQIKISGSANENADINREGRFFIKSSSAWNYTKQIKIIQDRAIPFLEPEESKISLSGGTDTVYVKVRANCTYNTVCNEAWLKISSTDSILQICSTPNTSNNVRMGNIDLHYSDNISTIEVSQVPASIYMIQYRNSDFTGKVTTSDGELDLSYYYTTTGSSHPYYLSIISEAPWEASISGSYTSIEPKSGDIGTTNVVLHNGMLGLYNPTNAKVYIRVGGETRLTIKFW